MSDLSMPAATRPSIRPPFHPGVWDWTPRGVHQPAAPLQAKRPLGGSEGVPETQPDTEDLFNIALTVIAGIGITVALTTLVRAILPKR